MSNLMARGLASHRRILTESAAVTITLTRYDDDGDAVSWTVTDAVVAQTNFANRETPGPQMAMGMREYLIPCASYRVGAGNVATEPADKDRITETINGVPVVFELVPQNGYPSWSYMDSTRKMVRVRVNEVNT